MTGNSDGAREIFDRHHDTDSDHTRGNNDAAVHVGASATVEYRELGEETAPYDSREEGAESPAEYCPGGFQPPSTSATSPAMGSRW
ncbi:hypothetical protein DL769_009932 [Monosporascus sp. CRB-8-3]|nr:hypothetical protein DL769_009932 [Monosporascus sp. CRB-8-3]